ncbi:hypothetical protein NL676_003641 [Syzygium grande]|nr:hypothetical protein NL676_003641 [Syzygium grande]
MVIDNEEEELQAARGKIRTFKGENAYRVARLMEIPSEIDVEVGRRWGRKEAITTHCEDNVELETECFDSSDSNWSFVTSDEEELEIEEAVRRKSTHAQYDETTEIPHFALNMVFDGPKQFKEAINKYAATRRVNIDFIKNDKDEEIVEQREANQLVMEMHHNSATTQKPGLEGSRAISLLRNTNHDVDNAKKVESASRKVITIMGLQV